MNQNSNTNNSNFLNDCLTVAFDPDTLNLALSALHQNPNIVSLGLNMMQQHPELTANYVQRQANMIRGTNQSANLAQEKEILAKQNQELHEENTKLKMDLKDVRLECTGLNDQNKKLKTELSNANKKITDLENKINKMEKNTIKMNTANLKTSSMKRSLSAKLYALKNEFGQSQEQKPVLENSTVNQI